MWKFIFIFATCVAFSGGVDIVEDTMDYIKKGQDSMKLSPNEEGILVVGNTGSGKSTLVHYIAANASWIESLQPEDPEAINYDVKDHYDDGPEQISSTVSRTIIPELVIDHKEYAWYDCPGFSDSRNSSIEIATTYFVKRVVDNIKSLKIVFVVNHGSVLKDYDRNDFDVMIRHGVTLLRQMERYKPSVALVVSKNPSVRTLGMSTTEITEESAINAAGKFISDYRLVHKDKPESAEKMKLIDALLQVDQKGKYNRIGIFFRPNAVGTFDKIPKLAAGRESLRKLIFNNIEFTKTQPSDFGYTLSERAELDVQNMTKLVNKNITKTLSRIDKVLAKELDVRSSKIYSMYRRRDYFNGALDEYQSLENNVSNVSPRELMTRVRELCSKVNVSINHNDLQNLMNQQRHMNILSLISNNAIVMSSSEWAEKLKLTKAKVNDGTNWNNFLVYLYELMSSYQVQKRPESYNVKDVSDWGVQDKPQGLYIHANNFDAFLKKHVGFYELLKDFNMKKKDYEDLNEIIRVTVQTRADNHCDGNTLVVSGEFVRITDINLTTCDNIVNVHVLAQNTFFVDESLRFEGIAAFAVIANVWNVVRKLSIDLTGTDVTATPPKNVNGTFERPFGVAGKPGAAGNNGANFFGFANEIVGEELEINISGGKGGRGQDGSHAYPEAPAYDLSPGTEYNSLYGYDVLASNQYKYRKIDGLREDSESTWLFKLVVCKADDGYESSYTLYARQCCKDDGLAGKGTHEVIVE